MPLGLIVILGLGALLFAVSGGHPLQWIDGILNKPAAASSLKSGDKDVLAVYASAGTPIETIRALVNAQFGHALEIIAPEVKGLAAGATVPDIEWKASAPPNITAIFGTATPPDGWYIPVLVTANVSVADLKTVNQNALNPNVPNILLADVLTNYAGTTS